MCINFIIDVIIIDGFIYVTALTHRLARRGRWPSCTGLPCTFRWCHSFFEEEEKKMMILEEVIERTGLELLVVKMKWEQPEPRGSWWRNWAAGRRGCCVGWAAAAAGRSCEGGCCWNEKCREGTYPWPLQGFRSWPPHPLLATGSCWETCFLGGRRYWHHSHQQPHVVWLA